jgi:hypothetical protein
LSASGAALLDNAYNVLVKSSGTLSEVLRWFDGTTLSHWKDVPSAQKLRLAAGVLPPEPLKLEQYADLLQFPVLSVRPEAAAALKQSFFPEGGHSTISLLASPKNRLTRYQNIFLLTALGLDKETRYSFIAKWFEMKPDPQTVLNLVIERRGITQIDPLNIEGARYVSDKNVEISRSQLQKLLMHQEPLARALAYAKLDLTKAVDVQILRKMLKEESSPELKEQIRLKLEDVWLESQMR